MTKKRSSEILDDKSTFFKIFQRFRIWSENKLSPNFCPPNIYDKSSPLWCCDAHKMYFFSSSLNESGKHGNSLLGPVFTDATIWYLVCYIMNSNFYRSSVKFARHQWMVYSKPSGF